MHSEMRHRSPFKAGTTLFRYRLSECIGIGGMGWVFRAIDTALEDYEIALKIFYPHLLRSIDSHLFEAEVLTSRRLTHPHIVQVYNYHRLSDDLAVMSMELVAGFTLEEHLHQNSLTDSLDIPLTIARIAAGLAYAHRCGVLHRDIKPENILLNAALEPKVADFGIAQLLADSEDGRTQKFAGTPAYMSPEQFAGEVLHPASDVYSFGCLIYFLLHKQPPFPKSSFYELATRHCQDPLPTDKAVLAAQPSWLRELLARCTEKNPDKRFASMDETLQFIEEASGNTFPREDAAPQVHFSTAPETTHVLPDVEEGARPVLQWILYLHAFVLLSSAIGMVFSDDVGFPACFIITLMHGAGLFCRKSIRWANSLVQVLVCFGTLAYFNPWSRERAMISLLEVEQLTGIEFMWIKEQLQTPISLRDPRSLFDTIPDSSGLRVVLNSPMDKLTRGPRGETLLHIVPHYLSPGQLRAFQSHGVDINARDMRGRTPLRYAIDRLDTSKMTVLITCGADVEQPDYHGVSPVAAALNAPNPLFLEQLICAGASPNGKMGKGSSTSYLEYAIEMQDARSVACLLRNGAQLAIDGNRFRELEQASKMNPSGKNYRVIRELLKSAALIAKANDKRQLENTVKANDLEDTCNCLKWDELRSK